MARIELRDTTIKFKDGFGGTALVNDTLSLVATPRSKLTLCRV
jgi:hypothetical protein